MDFLFNWFVASEVISGTTCRHLAVLDGLGNTNALFLGKNSKREKKHLLETPFTTSLFHRKFEIFIFFNGLINWQC